VTDNLCYIVTIEGVANAEGIAKYCYPVLPDYAAADDQYNTGLAEPPTGVSSEWRVLDHRISTGRFRIVLRPDVGPVNWYTTRKPAISDLSTAITSATDTGITHALDSSDIGIAVGTILYIERETLKVSAESTNTFATVGGRGFGESEAVAHAAFMDLHTVPPAMGGRLVKVYKVNQTGETENDETEILRGYIVSEVSSGIHWPAFECQERFVDFEVNKRAPQPWNVQVLYDEDDAPFSVTLFNTYDMGWNLTGEPRFHDDGAYFYIPALNAVLRGTYDSTADITGQAWTLSVIDFIWPVGAGRDSVPILWAGTPESADNWEPAHEMILSHADTANYPYPVFGFTPDEGSFTASDNPVDIALNLILSKDTANLTTDDTNWDVGVRLYPEFALGIEIAKVDMAAFKEARALLKIVRAKWLWLGGPESEKLEDVFHRLLAPWGYAVGTKRDGTWTIVAMGDTYPGGALTVLDETNILNPGEMEMVTVGRSLDTVVMDVGPGPDGETNKDRRVIREITGRTYFPAIVGKEEKFDRSPYDPRDLHRDSDAYDFVANRMRLFADRVATIRNVGIGPQLFDTVELAGGVTIHDLALRNPHTGSRLTASDDPLNGVITSVDNLNYRTRQCSITIAVTGQGKVARFAPTATVAATPGWADADPWSVNVDNNVDTEQPDQDASKFTVGDEVMILDSRGVERASGFSIDAITINTPPTADVISFDGDPGVDPVEGDLIVFDDWDAVDASQQTNYAYAADGGADGDASTLGAGSDAPYLIGS